jgi:hypothetical protein
MLLLEKENQLHQKIVLIKEVRMAILYNYLENKQLKLEDNSKCIYLKDI